MPFPDASPYQILEISPSASLAEIMKGYQNALRKKRYPRARVTQVFNELRNVRKRAEHDLLTFCNIGDIQHVKQLLANLPKYPFVPTSVMPLPIQIVQPLEDERGVNEDFLPIPDCEPEFQQTTALSEPHSVLIPFPFPA